MARWGTLVAVVLAGSVVGYFGYGRWWGEAHAEDIREAILRQLYAEPAYVQFRKEMFSIYGAGPTIDIWLSVPELPVERSSWDKVASPAERTLWDRWAAPGERGGKEGSTEWFPRIWHRVWHPYWFEKDRKEEEMARYEDSTSYRKTVSRLDHTAGPVSDGRYRVSLVARTALSTALLEKPVKLAEYIGEAELAIHNGKLRTISVNFLDLPRISSLHDDIVSILRSTRREELDAIHPGTRRQLLDATACSFRNAAHIQQLFEDSADSLAQRLLHAVFLARWPFATYYHRGDHFTVASAGRLRLPEALTLGEGESCRVCVLATRMNSFGEPVDASQAIVALEQISNKVTTAREVARVDAIEFDTRIVNGLLTGDTLSVKGGLGALVLVAICTIFGLVVLLALMIVRQIQLLLFGADRSVTIKNKSANESPSKA